jgi:hypothetical protein
MRGREIAGAKQRCRRAERLFWLGAGFCVALLVAGFQSHALLATLPESRLSQGSGAGGGPVLTFDSQVLDGEGRGALTLEACHGFDAAQPVDLQSDNSISAAALMPSSAEIAEPPVRRLRANDPRLTLSLDSATRSLPAGLEN